MTSATTVTELLQRGADTAVAIAAPGREHLTYAELRQHVAGTVEALNSLGVGRNDPVAIVVPNGPEMASAFVAIAAGATTAPLNPAYKAGEFEFYLSDLGNNTYRRIDYHTGIITRVAGSGKKGRGGDGGPALEAEMDTTCGIAVDDAGNLYLSSEWGNNIRRVDAATGIIELFAGLDGRHYPSEDGDGRPFTRSDRGCSRESAHPRH